MSNAYLDAYEKLFKTGKTASQKIVGLAGRIVRGDLKKNPRAFDRLTDDPNRRVVFLVDSSGLEGLLGLNGYEMLQKVGWDDAYIESKIKSGVTVKLVIFPETACKLGTWDNVLHIVEEKYPEVWGKIKPHRKEICALQPEDLPGIEAKLGYSLKDVDNAGSKDPRYMTIDRFQTCAGSLEECRAFLYFTVYLKEQYTGNGYTRNTSGQRGVPEFIVPDEPLSNFEHRIMDIAVTLPASALAAITARSQHKDELPLPVFFDPRNAESYNYAPNLNQLFDDATAWAKQHGIKPSGKDAFRIHVLNIDDQKDFLHPQGSLYVGGRSQRGAVEDSARKAAWIYRNLHHITDMTFTMDTHFSQQIFVRSMWLGEDGQHVPTFTEIPTEKVVTGKIRPNPAVASWLCDGNYGWLQKQMEHYCKELEKKGKYTLLCWPFHCLLGSPGHSLLGLLNEAQFFHAWARGAQSNCEVKGGHPLTENYSVLSPEVLTRHDGKALAQRNTSFVKKLLSYDAVIIAGQAASHCVKSSIDDLLDEILVQDPKLAAKCHILTDCMSSVVTPYRDYTPETEAALAKFANAGMKLHKSTDPLAGWDGIRL